MIVTETRDRAPPCPIENTVPRKIPDEYVYTQAADVLGDVWRDVERAHVGHEGSCVVAFVGAESDPTGSGRMAHDHLLGRLALGGAGRRRHRRRDDEPVAIFHQRMAHEAELGLLAPSLAVQLRLGIRGRDMGIKSEKEGNLRSAMESELTPLNRLGHG